MIATKSVKPIQHSVTALAHRPIYSMHRYFARRPYSVFLELIGHYSKPGEVILDPFCGGGVTLVEGVLQGRRVVGFDSNPLAAFITEMELTDVKLPALKKAQLELTKKFADINDQLFATLCRKCGKKARALWFEYSALVMCPSCSRQFSIIQSEKTSVGTWKCPHCDTLRRFSPQYDTAFKLENVYYSCTHCNTKEITKASKDDTLFVSKIEKRLKVEELRGLWIPDSDIPDCNMQRESALFKKGITKFRQLFTARHLLCLGLLREHILGMPEPSRKFLLFIFSSTLRYTNRMVTHNPGWRGNRPLEWAKPGFWLPPVHLEANVMEEYSRRCSAAWRGKEDYLKGLGTNHPVQMASAQNILKGKTLAYHVSSRSSTHIPLPDECVDSIITDPPYGSYVHYADLSNFWAVWLKSLPGLGCAIDASEEAVIARKKFPGAKSAIDYQQILEKCFLECFRVLKPNSYMVMTFNNREPRAWAALLIAATKAGFDLHPNGVIFQDGVASYRHTAQSRRVGSVIGDFILSFQRPTRMPRHVKVVAQPGPKAYQEQIVKEVEKILRANGPLTPNELMSRLYIMLHPYLLRKVKTAIANGEGAVEELIKDFDEIQIFDSHRRQLLEKHFHYEGEKWSLRAPL